MEGMDWVRDVGGWLKEQDDDDSVLVDMLLSQVQQTCLVYYGIDEFFWAENEENGFSVKSCAEEPRRRDLAERLQPAVLSKLRFMWKMKVPSKVSIYAWRFILGRLPARDQLKNRCILVEERDCCCVFLFHCYGELQSSLRVVPFNE